MKQIYSNKDLFKKNRNISIIIYKQKTIEGLNFLLVMLKKKGLEYQVGYSQNAGQKDKAKLMRDK